jgi:hypothetical protein
MSELKLRPLSNCVFGVSAKSRSLAALGMTSAFVFEIAARLKLRPESPYS